MRDDTPDIVRVFRGKSRFLIACHENPEGDAIGSELALALVLRKMGKTATVLNADPVPDNLRFLPGASSVVFEADGSDYEVAVVVDCGSPDRTGKVKDELLKCPILVNIDHHRTNEAHGHHVLIDPDAAATGVLIRRVLEAMGVGIDRDEAINIYTAVLTDTGSFHYGNSSPEAFRIAGEMVGLGIDPWEVSEKVYETQNFGRLRLLGRVLESLELHLGGRVASIATTRKDLDDFGASKDWLEGFINYPRSIAGVEVAVSFRDQEDGATRVSFRSKGRFDVSRVASRFGGGGHRNAAGCTVADGIAAARRQVLAALEETLV